MREELAPNGLRETPFEEYEERLALSAQPLTALFGSTERLGDSLKLESPIAQYSDVTTQGNAGASWTDVQYVQSKYGLTGAGQTVAIIDSGIAYDHPALGGGFGTSYRVVGGWDFAENDANPYDDAPAGFHGTHVAGIVGANSSTYPGLAPNVDLVGLRVFDDNGNGQFAWIEQALQWVVQHKNDYRNPITTVNLSVGLNLNSNDVPAWANLEDEFAQLKNAGIVITVSAGNAFQSYKTPGLSYPAVSPDVIPVASVDSTGALSSFSQRNQRVLAAPGQGIVSTVPDYLYSKDGVPGDYASATGTSMAAPYVAGASVLVREAMQRVGYTSINEDTIYNLLRSTADSVYDSITSASYLRVNLRRAIDTVMASAAPTLGNPTPAPSTPAGSQVSLGNVDFYYNANLKATGDTTYTLTAARSGIFTAETLFNATGGNLQLEIRDAAGQVLATSSASGRADANVAAGQQLAVHITGTNNSMALRLTNLVVAAGDTVTLYGTSGDDLHVFVAGTYNHVAANGVDYGFLGSQFRNVVVQAGAGNDTLVAVGSQGSDTASVGPGTVVMTDGNYRLTAGGVEVTNLRGGGGIDVATLTDSLGNDTFNATPSQATLAGAGFSNTVVDFATATAYFSNGYDQVALYGSVGDDTFQASSTSAYMQGPGFVRNAVGYDTIAAVGGWGNDIARLIGTAGDETFSGDSSAGSLSGSGFYLRAENFERVEARSGGGNDTAYLYDSAGIDTFVGQDQLSYLGGSGFLNQVENFRTVYASSSGGADVAVLYGSVGNDQLTIAGRSRRLQATDYVLQTDNFNKVWTYAGDGDDTLAVQDLASTDAVTGRADWINILNGDSVTNFGFERVVAAAKTGQNPRSDVQAVDYLFSKTNW
jgi:subtilisin family serine protease